MAGHLPLFPFGEVNEENAVKVADTFFGDTDNGDISSKEFLYNIQTIMNGFTRSRVQHLSRSCDFNTSVGVSEIIDTLPNEYAKYSEEDNKVSIEALKDTLREKHGSDLKFTLKAYYSSPKKYKKKRVGGYEVHYLLVERENNILFTFGEIVQIYYVA